MHRDEQRIEKMITDAGKTAPRITLQRIEDMIGASRVAYHVFPGTTVTVCCITLPNGFCLVGHSAAASPENFDRKIGEEIALSDAREKLWQLEGYVLRQKLYEMKSHPYGEIGMAMSREKAQAVENARKEALAADGDKDGHVASDVSDAPPSTP